VLDWRLARRLALDILLTEHMASDPWDHIRAAAMRGVNRAFPDRSSTHARGR